MFRPVDEGWVVLEVEHVWACGHGGDDGGPAGDLDAELVAVDVGGVVLGRVDAGDVEAILAAAELVLGLFGWEGVAEDGAVGACEAEGEGEGLCVGDDVT